MATPAARALPFPMGSGGFPILGETGDWASDPLAFAQQRHARYGLVWRTHLLGRPCAVLLGPAANRFILSSHMHLFSSRQGWGAPITRLIGDGLSLLDGANHRRHRAMIMPALHGAFVRRFFDDMLRTIDAHSASWRRVGQIRLFDAFKRLSFEIAGRVILGLNDESALHALFGPFKTFTHGLFAPPAWRIPGLPYERAWRAGKHMRHTLLAIIADQRAAPRESVLSQLIAACDADGQGFSDAELLDELLVLLWAGHDTITALLTWVFYELLHHPQVEAAVRAEQAAFGAGPLAPEQLRQFPLLDRVLREAERLHPPAPGGFRGVVESFAYDGYHIPAGWTVMYSSVFTHRMPELWRNPDTFDPERFAPPCSEGAAPFQLIGFGGGPRVCVGLAFAQMQMRMVLAQLLRTTRFALVEGQRFRVVHVPTPMPRDGLLVRVQAQ